MCTGFGEGVDCDDENACTIDTCNVADGECVYTNEADETACDADGDPGTCQAGVCTGFCEGVDCDDENVCTIDACNVADGECVYTNEADGTTCDALGLPGECVTGACVAICMPTPGINVTLPTSGAPTPIYTNTANGFEISAVNCATPTRCDVTFSPFGVGSNAYGDIGRFDPSDSLLISFFDQEGNPRNANTVSIELSAAGVSGTVDVRFDGGLAVPFPAVIGQAIDLSGTSAHEIEVTSTSGAIFWKALSYNHECL